jgi:copper transport protein
VTALTRIAAAVVVAVSAAALALPSTAGAHAVVERTSPVRSAALERAPERVTVTFDEPVESSFGALRVFAAGGERVDDGELLRPSAESIATRLEDGLPDGAYTATYRVVSADSHPVTGGFSFTVGDAGGAPAAAVADLLGDASAGPVTAVAFGAARAVAYGATALLVGGCLFLLAVWLPALGAVAAGGGPAWSAGAAAFERRFARLLIAAACAGAIATGVGIVAQAATVTGGTVWSALDTGLLNDVLDTRFGEVWKLRLSAFALLVPLLLYAPPLSARTLARRPLAVGVARVLAFAVALGYLVVAPALAGHAGAGDDAVLAVPLDVVHVAAMSAWIGGVALLALAVPAATRKLAGAARTRLLAAAVARFSTVALVAVAALLASGVAQSIVELDAFADLVETAFGRAILIKAAIFTALVALGAHNRRRSQPALRRLADSHDPPGSAGIALRRALRAELALMVAVLGVTAALVSYSPSAGAAASGPFAGSADLGPAQLELTVDPARVGRNELHIYLFDSRSGAQYDKARSLRVSARERERDIGPIELRARRAGPGHYTVARAELAPAGDWTIAVRAAISDFEELRGELEVPIR